PCVAGRLARLNWKALEAELWERGHALTAPILTSAECEELVSLYGKEELFRKTIHMAPRRFGEGDYKYFKYPLPSLVQSLRVHLYRRLPPIAHGWMEALRARERYPPPPRALVEPPPRPPPRPPT